MSEPVANPPQPERRQGLIASVLALLGKIAAILFVSWFLSLLMEWIGIALLWPEQGAEHSRQMMQAELQWFSDDWAYLYHRLATLSGPAVFRAPEYYSAACRFSAGISDFDYYGGV